LKTAGIDGCKLGWILISFDEGEEAYRAIETDEGLKAAFEEFDRIFIDMPIGLEDEKYTRECDAQLRKALGAEYSSSVFTPPIRPALHAPSYAEANMVSFDYTEKKLSLQAWNITPKIKLIDRLLTSEESFKEKVLESHPELLYQHLNDGMIFQKKNLKKGIHHRLGLIVDEEPVADDFFRDIKEEYRRSDIGEDDIVDAMVLALYAKWSKDKPIKTLPKVAEVDSEGLPKAVHYL
jgi:predicted RNase H-like nuclease